MSEWLHMGGYGVYVWPSYAIFLVSLLGGWGYGAWRARRWRQRIIEELSSS